MQREAANASADGANLLSEKRTITGEEHQATQGETVRLKFQQWLHVLSKLKAGEQGILPVLGKGSAGVSQCEAIAALALGVPEGGGGGKVEGAAPGGIVLLGRVDIMWGVAVTARAHENAEATFLDDAAARGNGPKAAGIDHQGECRQHVVLGVVRVEFGEAG